MGRTTYVLLRNSRTDDGFEIVRQVSAKSQKKALQKFLDQQPEPFEILTLPQHDELDTDYLVIAKENIGNFNVSFSDEYR